MHVRLFFLETREIPLAHGAKQTFEKGCFYFVERGLASQLWRQGFATLDCVPDQPGLTPEGKAEIESDFVVVVAPEEPATPEAPSQGEQLPLDIPLSDFYSKEND